MILAARWPRSLAMILLLFSALGAACARAPRPALAPAPVSAPVSGYAQLREPLAARDLSPLRGRRVAVDPGHGGVFRGARGPGGLAEADVNLGVALALRDLLRAAGAEPLLTRETDRDFLTPADSSLAADLAARVALANAWRPDVFLSLHHNSTAPRDTSANETQTYYPLGRDGADLDLARAIHRHLVRNLEISPARILPGNYRVLRETSAPAVLGEPSMISHPAMERRLAQPQKQRLEAQAYFLGLLEYYAGGTPRWQPAGPDTVEGEREAFAWRFAAGGTAACPGPGLDRASISLTLDGVAQTVSTDTGDTTVWWRPPAVLASGLHRIVLRGRNLAGRATPVAALTWRKPPGDPWLVAEYHCYRNATGGIDSTRAGLLLWEAHDGSGARIPLRAHARLIEAPRPGGVIEMGVEMPTGADGRGWMRIAPRDLPNPCSVRLDEDCCSWVRRMTWGHFLPDLADEAAMIALRATGPWEPATPVPGGAYRLRQPQPSKVALATSARLHDPSAPWLLWARGAPFWLEADGALPLLGDDQWRGPWDRPDAPPPDTLVWRPLLPELIGKRILLDPAGGGHDMDGEPGPSGVRGTDLNLGVARALAVLLRGAGAYVLLTREDERWVAPEAKLEQAEATRADLVLTLRRSSAGEPPYAARHHETSARGRAWAKLFARAAQPLATAEAEDAASDSVLVAPASAYLLRQTRCPALEVALPPPLTPVGEERLERPDHQAACARALLLATAALLAGERVLVEALDPAALIAARPDLLPPVTDVAWACLDGNLPWLPPRWCRASGDTVSSGEAPGLPCLGVEHTLEVRTATGWRLVALRRGDGDEAIEMRVLDGSPD